MQGPGHRSDLGKDIDAVPVLLDHPGDATDLSLDAVQAPHHSCHVDGGFHGDSWWSYVLPPCSFQGYGRSLVHWVLVYLAGASWKDWAQRVEQKW
ncbi:hypothetical protein GCM10025781_17120 [Kocuria gwangalliensis]|uniref:Uncharacterized protein n=1 Tax=Kocuria gwangalliensis TaxID=501592 RepID=A0ABP8X6C4_9MICC